MNRLCNVLYIHNRFAPPFSRCRACSLFVKQPFRRKSRAILSVKGKPIIIWGATGQAKVLAEFSEQIGFRLVALFDNNPATERPFPSVPLFYGTEGFEKWRAETSERDLHSLVAIGGSRGEDRIRIQSYLERHG